MQVNFDLIQGTGFGVYRTSAGNRDDYRHSAPTFDVAAALPPDAWDNWCSARDRREEQARSVQYVSREMAGMKISMTLESGVPSRITVWYGFIA